VERWSSDRLQVLIDKYCSSEDFCRLDGPNLMINKASSNE